MRRILTTVMLASLLGLPRANASANHSHPRSEQGPRCGGKYVNDEGCSFRFKGGQLYVSASARGMGLPTGMATIRLEAVSQITGQRRVLLTCTTTASGACSAGGSFDTFERPRKGQRLFCRVEGVGRGLYECGSIVKKQRS